MDLTSGISFSVEMKMPYDIKDVKIEYEKDKTVKVDPNQKDENGNYKTKTTYFTYPYKVIVYFEDGTQTEAVCDKEDKFDLEIGISICLTKKLLRDRWEVNNATKTYNRLIKNGVKKVKENKEAERLEKEAKEAKKIREAAKQRRRIRKAEKKKEREIEILAEAIRRSRDK